MIPSRRTFLKSFLLGLTTPFLSKIPVYSQPKPKNPIIEENQKPGTKEWQLTNPAINHEIEGYANLTSVNLGKEIKLFINTKDPNYTIEIFRMGWYNGDGGRRITQPINLTGIQQPPPLEDEASALIECDWKNPYILTIPDDWVSGVYLAKLTGSKSNKQSYIMFVVRDDFRPSDILFQSSVTTFQAYNNWGEKSLYRWNSTVKQAYKVSFNRPYAASPNSKAAYGVGAGEFLTNFQPANRVSSAGWEYNMVRWLEKEGYDVSYCTNIDTHFNKRLLLKPKAFLSVGHDEYWSYDMRQNIENARDEGVNLGFFSANTCYWQIRLEPSRITGESNRTIVSYKEMAANDPFLRVRDEFSEKRVTTLWRDELINRPEDSLIGVMYETFQVDADITLDDAPEWLLANTGLKKGDKLAGLLGYEVDKIYGNAPKSLIRVCHSPYEYKGDTRYGNSTLYTADSGAIVFAAGTIQWSWGLDDFNAPLLRSSRFNLGVQQITRNVLDKMVYDS